MPPPCGAQIPEPSDRRKLRYDQDRLAPKKTEPSPSGPLRPITPQLREQLILEHLPHVGLIARRIAKQLPESVAFDDLVSAGVIGLFAAIDHYDSRDDVKLTSYVQFRIRDAILDSLRNLDWLPRQQRRRAKLLEAAISGFEQERHPRWIEEEIGGQGQFFLFRYQDSDEHRSSQSAEELERLLAEFIEKMPQLERTVLSRYYDQDLTIREIAKIEDLPESRVSQLKSQAISRIQSFLSEKRREMTSTETQSSASELPEPRPSSHSSEISEKDLSASSAANRKESPASLIDDPTIRILMAAAAAFQKLETGRSWLLTASPALGNVAPLSLISTPAGREIIANELGLIEHGMF